MSKQIEFYKKLKLSLEETTEFPTKYMFKFIIPADDNKVLEIENIFNHTGAVIDKKSSKTGKYISLTILVQMVDADAIIMKYKEVSKVEGVISL
ncbi:DUF493 family protein [Aureibaculum sp. 2210JD6-5]|uniref:DUF493 family protein n=1 Tax=Aureibaculum sp. 2210JD6-5 TaxID=3103957 RepID=UPI002AAE3B73|nr:DUF493 family protein [Aureibaculum sp. 2210JD6-5]MDY7395157.1 DUF493 family protein [Aureibaculum sp. 2210JD6-5]